MQRIARQKTPDSIFHIMARSISEVQLFKDADDKLKYLYLVKSIRSCINSGYTATASWITTCI